MVRVELILVWREALVLMLSSSFELVRSIPSLNHNRVLFGPPWASQVNSSVSPISTISWSKMIVGVDGATVTEKKCNQCNYIKVFATLLQWYTRINIHFPQSCQLIIMLVFSLKSFKPLTLNQHSVPLTSHAGVGSVWLTSHIDP